MKVEFRTPNNNNNKFSLNWDKFDVILFIYLFMKSRYKQSKCFRFQYIWAYFISYYLAPFHIQHNNNIVITKMWWKRNDSIFALDFSWYGKPYTEKKPIVNFSQNIMLASFYASISRFHWQYLMVYQYYVKIFHRLMDKMRFELYF